MLTDVQKLKLMKWRRNSGAHFRAPWAHAMKLLEEAVELCFAMGSTIDGVRRTVEQEIAKAVYQQCVHPGRYDRQETFVELGDVAVCCAVVSYHSRLQVPAAVDACIERVQSREWAADSSGVLRRPT